VRTKSYAHQERWCAPRVLCAHQELSTPRKIVCARVLCAQQELYTPRKMVCAKSFMRTPRVVHTKKDGVRQEFYAHQSQELRTPYVAHTMGFGVHQEMYTPTICQSKVNLFWINQGNHVKALNRHGQSERGCGADVCRASVCRAGVCAERVCLGWKNWKLLLAQMQPLVLDAHITDSCRVNIMSMDYLLVLILPLIFL